MSISDNFNRPDEDPLSDGGLWEATSGSLPLALVSNRVENTSLGIHRSNRIEEFTGDMEALIEVVQAVVVVGAALQVLICLQDTNTATWDGYQLTWINHIGLFEDNFLIEMIEDGIVTHRFVGGCIDQQEGVGNPRFALRRSGDILEAWHEGDSGVWEWICAVEDTTFTSGRVGIGITDVTVESGQLDNFCASGGGEFLPQIIRYHTLRR